MLLAQLTIKNAKPREKPYKLRDGSGLYLLVSPNGSKLWRLRYRFSDKQNMLSFGGFPEVSLASARTKRDEARKLLAEGVDPSQQRRLDKIAAATAARNTFAALVEDYLAKLEDEGSAESTMSKNRWLLQELAVPLAKRPINEITPAEILVILKRIEKTGRRETAAGCAAQSGPCFVTGSRHCEPPTTRRLRFAEHC
jgi:DNA-binding TFAR19-related protein (PDSD5 family)